MTFTSLGCYPDSRNFLLWFPTPTLEKMIKVRPLAVSYGWTVLKQNQSQVPPPPPCSKTANDSLKMSVWHAVVAQENPECYLRPCCYKTKLAFQLTNPPLCIVKPWRNNKSTRPMYNLTSRALNLPQTITGLCKPHNATSNLLLHPVLKLQTIP